MRETKPTRSKGDKPTAGCGCGGGTRVAPRPINTSQIPQQGATQPRVTATLVVTQPAPQPQGVQPGGHLPAALGGTGG